MEKTVLVGDHIVVDKLVYARPGVISKYFLPYAEPKHGDIVVFQSPAERGMVLVKRLIGAPGDHIKLVDQKLFRNGVEIREPYVFHGPVMDSFQVNYPPPAGALTQFSLTSQQYSGVEEMLTKDVVNGELVIPPGHYFMMGDNRENSLDSRYWGLVPRDNIIGKPVFVFWSYEANERDLMPGNAQDIFHHTIDLAEHFFTRTRWSRTFHIFRGYHDN